jgi:Serine/threonine protein kinase
MAPADIDLPVIPGFRVTGCIGEGGMGSVYAAEDLSLGRRVAIKLILERIAGESESKVRFQREARTLATIQHPNVVHVYSLGECDAGSYIVMEYVEGETLAEKLQREGMFAVDEAIAITRQVVTALQEAWSKSVIHRDVKPSNVLIDSRGRVKVVDFGLAKSVSVRREQRDETLTQSGYIVGSPHYLSPEQAQGHTVDFRSDIYAVGLILYEMLTGSRPFVGSTPVVVIAKHLHEPLPSVALKRAGIPPRLVSLISRMTAKLPGERPASYEEILRELDAVLVVPTNDMGDATATVKLSRPRTKRNRYIAAASVTIVAIVAIIWMAMRPKQAAPVRPLSSGPMVIAVAPFYGPDPDSQKEGQVMAALIEKEIGRRLPGDVRVIGITQTRDAIQSHGEASALAERLHADVVIWGEAFALRNETEIQPYVTLVPRPAPARAVAQEETSALFAARAEQGGDHAANVMRLASTMPNQIELHRTSAAGVADVVFLVAGTHALYSENNPAKALDIFRRAPQTADTLRYQAEALFRTRAGSPQFPPPYAPNFDYWAAVERAKQSGKVELTRQVLALLDRAIELDPADAQSFAMRADLLCELGEFTRASVDYQTAAMKGTPYTTRHAILFDGKFFAPEIFRSIDYGPRDEVATTSTLLTLDPRDFHIVARRSLPGIATSFRVAGRWLEITFAPAGKESKVASAVIRYDGTNFDRPVFYGSNVLVRMRTMKAGWLLAENFLDEFGPDYTNLKVAHFRPRVKELSSDAPATYEQLEVTLRRAIDRDPTQPWHRFYLGQSLWARGARAEAEEVWRECFAHDEPGTPYFEYAWMSARFLREGIGKWADRAYAMALAKRRAYPQAVTGGSLIERLISVPFVRAAALDRRAGSISAAEGYEWLRRTREIGGFVFDGDDIVATLWAGDFEAHGDHTRAATERDVARRLTAAETNVSASATLRDAAYDAAIAATIGMLFVFVAILLRIERLPRESEPERSAPAKTPLRIAAWTGAIGLAVFLLIRSALVWPRETALVAVLVLIAAAAVRWMRQRATFASMVAAVPRGHLIVAIVSIVVAAYAAFLVLVVETSRAGTEGIPIVTSDSIGSPGAVSFLEDACRRRDSADCRYALAVAHHLAGDGQRARELYASLGDDRRAVANFDALNRGSSVAVPLTVDEFGRAIVAPKWAAAVVTMGKILSGSRFNLSGNLDRVAPVVTGFVAACIVLLLIFARWAMVAPPRSTFEAPRHALMHGRIEIAYATVVLISYAATAAAFVLAVRARGTFVPGIWSAVSLEYIEKSSPLPKPLPLDSLEFFFAWPYARGFAWAVGLCLGAGVLLHVIACAIARHPRHAIISSE